MTYAIIETGGKQLRVEPGRFYDIELLSTPEEETVTIESVLLVQHNGEVTIGQPLVEGAKVEGTVMRHLRGRKVLVYKMKPKKKTRKKRGHRQEITRLMINSISLNGSVFTLEQTAAETESNVTSTEAEHPSAETVAETESNLTSTEGEHPSAETESNVTSTEADQPSAETNAES